MILAKANDALRKQVGLKQDRSKRQCVGLAAVMAMHISSVLLLFRRQELWLQFVLLGTMSGPTVGLERPCSRELCASCRLHNASLQPWGTLLAELVKMAVAAGVGCVLQDICGRCARAVLGHCMEGNALQSVCF